MAVDLGAQRRLHLQHYALRHDGCEGGQLRNWELEAGPSLQGERGEEAWHGTTHRGAFVC
jgi:hypothetical protein